METEQKKCEQTEKIHVLVQVILILSQGVTNHRNMDIQQTILYPNLSTKYFLMYTHSVLKFLSNIKLITYRIPLNILTFSAVQSKQIKEVISSPYSALRATSIMLGLRDDNCMKHRAPSKRRGFLYLFRPNKCEPYGGDFTFASWPGRLKVSRGTIAEMYATSTDE